MTFIRGLTRPAKGAGSSRDRQLWIVATAPSTTTVSPTPVQPIRRRDHRLQIGNAGAAAGGRHSPTAALHPSRSAVQCASLGRRRCFRRGGDFGRADAVASRPPGEEPSFGAAGGHTRAVVETDRYALDARACSPDHPGELMRAFASGRDSVPGAAVGHLSGRYWGGGRTPIPAPRAPRCGRREADRRGAAVFCLEEDQRVGATCVDEDRMPGIDGDRRRAEWMIPRACSAADQEIPGHPREL